MVQKSGKFKSLSDIFEVHSSSMIFFLLFTEVDYLPDGVLLRLILKLTDISFSGTSQLHSEGNLKSDKCVPGIRRKSARDEKLATDDLQSPKCTGEH